MKTLAEAKIIARSSDPEWVGEELFRLQTLAAGAVTAEQVRSVVRDVVTTQIACVAGWSGFEPGSLKRMTEDIANDVARRLGLDT